MQKIIKSSKNKNYVFCYGTLKKYNCNHHYIKDSLYIGKAILHNVKMLDLGKYPGLVSGENSVKGEVYCVDDKTKKQLDHFEEVGTLYNDKEALVYVKDTAYLVHYYEMIEDGKTYPLCKDKDNYYRVDPTAFIWYIGNIENKTFLKKERFDHKEGYLIFKKDVDTKTLTYIDTHYDNVHIYKESTLD